MQELTTGKKIALGLQHVLAMFGATVLVPILTGLNPSIALLAAGIGTLLFHSVTKGIVPVFLGSSFAFIGAIKLTLADSGLDVVKGGIIAAGFVYILVSLLIKIFGVEKIKSFFPPIVTGPIIMVIGLRLSPVAINDAMFPIVDIVNDQPVRAFDAKYMLIALIVLLTMIIISIFAHGFFKLVPIIIAIFVGYLAALALGVVDLTPFKEAELITFTQSEVWSQLTMMPKFDWSGILAIAPIAFVVFIEHIGDITTNGAVVGKDFFKNPGVHRTMLGDGIATIFAGLIGGPANTTYSENTGVLAVTKVYSPVVIRIAAVFAIILGSFGHFGAFVTSIPDPVRGGVSIMLFGMIASVGVRILINSELDFGHSRNLIISAVILVLGIGISEIPIVNNVMISGLAIAAVIGVILNKVLPEEL